MTSIIQFPGLAAYVDIMGQRHEFDKLMETKWWEPNPETSAAWSATYGRVVRFRRDVIEFFKSSDRRSAESFWNIILEPETNPSLGEGETIRVKTLFFGDSALIFLSLDMRNGLLPLDDIYGVLTSCAMLLTFSLARGYSVRGGIEIGPCLHDSESDEDYGPAIGSAVDLESKADYHRILVGERLLAYLNDIPMATGNILSDANNAISHEILSLIGQDTDGYTFIDFLGNNSATRKLWNSKSKTEIYNKAARFVADQLDAEDVSDIVRAKYERLKEYLLSRSYLWNGFFAERLSK
jgi:hypothetical protein